MPYQMNHKMKQLIIQKSEEIFEKIRGYREYIHANPELSYEEHETMAFISEKLDELGIDHTTRVGKTGIVAVIRGDHHTKEDHAIGLRADMDALPILEETNLSFASKKMVSCMHVATMFIPQFYSGQLKSSMKIGIN